MIEQPTVNLSFLARDLGLIPEQVEIAVKLLDEGGTVPFIARYRKDVTKNLNEDELRSIYDRLREQRVLADRKLSILRQINILGKLTPELEKKIREARTNRHLEELYIPYRQRKQSLAQAAREKGLEPFAMEIISSSPEVTDDLLSRAAAFVNSEKGVESAEEALQGAGYILAEMYHENVDLCSKLRDYLLHHARLVSKKAKQDVSQQPSLKAGTTLEAEKADSSEVPNSGDAEENSVANIADAASSEPEKKARKEKANGKKKNAQKSQGEDHLYRDYYQFSTDLRRCPSYRVLAMNRGERDKILTVHLEFDREEIEKIAATFLETSHRHYEFLSKCLEDALSRLILPSLERQLRREMTEDALRQSAAIFSKNLRNLLLQKPLLRRRVLAIDPGYRFGCKMAALDEFGNVLAHETLYITGGAERKARTTARIVELIKTFSLQVIAIGNGTGSRDAEDFVAKMIAEHFPEKEVVYIVVNEAGASVYSVSPQAKEEFPSYDAMARGAISIGRRLQDPLNELVKVDPASLGVGSYQHELKAKELKETLSEVVESCVNHVGVDLNSATPAILRYVAGLKPTIAKRIYDYRVENGPFHTREELKQVNGLGEVAFNNAARFLKVVDGYEPLDATWIHPESYSLAEKILAKIGYDKEDLRKPEKHEDLTQKILSLSVKDLAEEFGAGLMTIADILDQFTRPGRDPRESLPGPIFKKGVMKITDLTPGMELTGTVQNVVEFGAFVDIGLHESGLIHISRMNDRFVRDAHTCLVIGDIVKVWVVEVDTNRRRISLSMLPPGVERTVGSASSHSRSRRSERDDSPRVEPQSLRSAKEGARSSSYTKDRFQKSSARENSEQRKDTERPRRFSRTEERPPRSLQLKPEKEVKPITSEMKEGKVPMRSFSDLAQLFGRIQPTSEEKK